MTKPIPEPEPITFASTHCKLGPSDKQHLFLGQRSTKEVFFGGAAGGGKSVALLMGALEYLDVPAYSALILRKDLARMELAGGLIWLTHQWFRETTAKWIANRKQWIFPNRFDDKLWPSTLMFGYLKSPLDKYRYASSEFQYIAFDELTDFTEEDYLFLFSRLRRNTSTPVPLRIRSASNPGGPGHLWVRERFVSGGAKTRINATVRKEGELDRIVRGAAFKKQGRLYLPSRIADNPGLDEAEYRETLLHLPPVVREQLMNGQLGIKTDFAIRRSQVL